MIETKALPASLSKENVANKLCYICGDIAIGNIYFTMVSENAELVCADCAEHGYSVRTFEAPTLMLYDAFVVAQNNIDVTWQQRTEAEVLKIARAKRAEQKKKHSNLVIYKSDLVFDKMDWSMAACAPEWQDQYYLLAFFDSGFSRYHQNEKSRAEIINSEEFLLAGGSFRAFETFQTLMYDIVSPYWKNNSNWRAVTSVAMGLEITVPEPLALQTTTQSIDSVSVHICDSKWFPSVTFPFFDVNYLGIVYGTFSIPRFSINRIAEMLTSTVDRVRVVSEYEVPFSCTLLPNALFYVTEAVTDDPRKRVQQHAMIACALVNNICYSFTVFNYCPSFLSSYKTIYTTDLYNKMLSSIKISEPQMENWHIRIKTRCGFAMVLPKCTMSLQLKESNFERSDKCIYCTMVLCKKKPEYYIQVEQSTEAVELEGQDMYLQHLQVVAKVQASEREVKIAFQYQQLYYTIVYFSTQKLSTVPFVQLCMASALTVQMKPYNYFDDLILGIPVPCKHKLIINAI